MWLQELEHQNLYLKVTKHNASLQEKFPNVYSEIFNIAQTLGKAF
jgi:hypothetical protein